MTSEFDFEQAIQQLIGPADPGVRDRLLRDLEELRNRGVSSWQDLAAMLKDPSVADERTSACWWLARLRGPGAFDLLVSALHDPDPHLRKEAARSLGVLGDMRAGLAEDLAVEFFQADKHWNRYSQLNMTVHWLKSLPESLGLVIARAIRRAGVAAYYGPEIGNDWVRSGSLAAELGL